VPSFASRVFFGTRARIVTLNLALALVVATLLAWTIYLLTTRVVEGEVQNTVQAELQGLAEQLQRDGYLGLVTAIRGRVAGADTDAVYLMTDAFGETIAGNLEAWPPTVRLDGSWQTLELYRVNARRPTLVGLRAFALPGGIRLMVGRDMRARAALAQSITRSLALVAGVAAVLTFLAGFLLSRQLMRRIATVTGTSEKIMAGDLAERVPLSGSDDEFDRLARSLNQMLDRIETLMTGMRTVTDSIAHDLKRPLTRLKSGLELSLREANRDGVASEVVTQALVDVDGVLKTLNALMDIARAESGLGHEHLERLDLGELALSLADIYAPLLEHKGVELTTSLEGSAYIRGHRELLTQAIVNVLENAARFAPSGSKIALSLARAQINGRSTVELRIVDGGPGIPAGERERVLERFVRLDGARGGDGSGLGLSLVAAVAKLHGAELRLEDNEPGLRVVLTFDRSEA